MLLNLIKKLTKSDINLLYSALPYRKSQIIFFPEKYLNWISETGIEKALKKTNQCYQDIKYSFLTP